MKCTLNYTFLFAKFSINKAHFDFVYHCADITTSKRSIIA